MLVEVIEVGVKLLNASRDLCSDLHGHERRQSTAGRDSPDDVAPFDGRRLELNLRWAVERTIAPIAKPAPDKHEENSHGPRRTYTKKHRCWQRDSCQCRWICNLSG